MSNTFIKYAVIQKNSLIRKLLKRNLLNKRIESEVFVSHLIEISLENRLIGFTTHSMVWIYFCDLRNVEWNYAKFINCWDIVGIEWCGSYSVVQRKYCLDCNLANDVKLRDCDTCHTVILRVVFKWWRMRSNPNPSSNVQNVSQSLAQPIESKGEHREQEL